jgi:hypothetical protein
LGFILNTMNKTLFLFFTSCFFFLSCNKETELLPQDIASNINTVSVIIDEQLWNSEVGDSVRNKFASPVLGLQQEEPLFTIKQYPIKLFEGFPTGSRNRIVIKKGNENSFKISTNEFSNTKNSFLFTGKSTLEILTLLEKNYPRVIRQIHQAEIEEYQTKIKDSLLGIKTISKRFHLKIDIPNKFEYVVIKKNFVWLKKEIISGNSSLLFYQIPLNRVHKGLEINDIIKIRDSIGNLYIHGRTRNSKMITEPAYFPYFSRLSFDDYLCYETKGAWQMKNDFMSGPFLNYCFKDKKNNRLMFIEGFCYVPSKETRDIMFELEAIIKSIEFNK